MFVAIAIMLVFILLIYLLPLVTKHIEKENERVYKAYVKNEQREEQVKNVVMYTVHDKKRRAHSLREALERNKQLN